MKKGTIYKIINNLNGFVYIGQTVQTLKRRWKKHKSDLQRKAHHNELLQKVYIKHGFTVFSVEKIEECRIEELDERERYWIQFYGSTNREKGYNFEDGGNEHKKHSQETIKKLVLTHRGHNNKLNVEQVIEIKKSIIAGKSITEIAEKNDVTSDCICKIKKLENWSYAAPELNEEVYNTDTSRKIRRLSQEEIEECKKQIINKKSAFELSQQYKIPYGRFLNMFKDELFVAKTKSKDFFAI